MPILDDDAANLSLANDYGAGRGSNAADEHELELWDGDPTLDDSAELTGGGYAAAEILPAAWSTPAGRSTQATATFPSPSGAWTAATHYVLRGDDGFGWDFGALAEPLYVTGAGDPPVVVVQVFYDNPAED